MQRRTVINVFDIIPIMLHVCCLFYNAANGEFVVILSKYFGRQRVAAETTRTGIVIVAVVGPSASPTV